MTSISELNSARYTSFTWPHTYDDGFSSLQDKAYLASCEY